MAIQVSAIETSEGVGLHFTKVLDVQSLGLVDEDEEVAEITDRNYWLKRGTPQIVGMADTLHSYILEFDPNAELNYNKFYIGLKINGRAKNYTVFRPKKGFLGLSIRIPETEENDALINSAGLVMYDYDKDWGAYRLKINEKDLIDKADTIKQLLQEAQKRFG
tara:strand:- start:546 stop:1034 length:489 start_codon:yes stop_codon:yes gene_type:complete